MNLASSSDEILLEALQQGSVDALEELYDRHHMTALAVAYRVLRDRDLAEDVVQEAFLAVWRQPESFRPERGSGRAWMLSIVRHRAIDFTRGRSFDRERLSLDEMVLEPKYPEPWQQVSRGLDRDRVKQAVDDLPPEQKDSIMQAYFGGYTQREISERTGVPLGTIKGRMRLGLQKLRAYSGTRTQERAINSLPFSAEAVHASSNDELEELASAFALEALELDEREDYSRHLQGCGVCRELVAQSQILADLLPEALEEVGASPGLKDRILSQARLGLEGEGRQAAVKSEHERLDSWGWHWPSWLPLGPVRVSAALGLLVAGLVVWNISLQLASDAEGDLTAKQRNLIEAIREGGTLFELSGTEAAPEASARLVQTPGSITVFVLVRNLPALPKDQEYEVWSIKGDVATSAGTFALAGVPEQPVTLTVDFSGASAIGISIEQKGGSPTGKPEGPIVLLGTP